MKKLVSLFLALVMALSMMSFAAAEEPFVITVLLPDMSPTEDADVSENNPVLKAIEEATGVRLQITYAANSTYGDTMNVTMADPSEKQPMLMVMTDARGTTMVNNARAGAFWDLTDFVNDSENYPNLAGSKGVYNNISIDGRIYGIYRTRAYPRAGIYYRKDIAAQMGITKVPETIEELTALANALNSYSEDTYALNMVSYTAGTINVITVAYGAPHNWGIDENGNIYPAHKSPAYLEGLNWLRNLYAAGGIDPNFATIDSSTWDNIERTNKAFMRFDCLDNAYRQQEWFEKNAGVTEQVWEMVGTLKKADGSISVWPQNAGFSGEIVVTKAVKEADLPKVVKFLDWANTFEGQMLLNWGVEGVTYLLDDEGYRVAAADQSETIGANSKLYSHSLNQLGMNIAGDLCTPIKPGDTAGSAMRVRYNELNTILTPYAVSDPCYPFVSETNVAFGTQLSTILSDAATQYIAGIISLEELQAAWQQWEEEGGAMMTEEYNDAYHASLGK
ncbi:MAG: extracellular solute-binding protein [Clostridia bacterium]|nr:extracellular solute-binding protein [Clostridia bacterium]